MTDFPPTATEPRGAGEPHPATTPRIARLRRVDLPRCAELEQELFAGDDPWSQAAFASELDSGCFFVGAYGPADDLLGYAGVALTAMGSRAEAEVHTIAVAQQHQGRGVGAALLHALLSHADEYRATVFLEVRTDNQPAIALYHKHDFQIIGLRKRYYQPSGADAYTMRRAPVTGESPTASGFPAAGGSTVEESC